ncbi:D-alanyl-D-alanine carboxypeptidase family protein [Acidaminobacterium chupaoyuni]
MKKTGKRLISLFLCGILLAGAAGAQEQAAAALSGVTSPSAILMDQTGQVIFEKNADEQREPASVTKIMTMLLVMEALDEGRLNWEDTVTASRHAISMGGSQIWLKENEQMSVADMLKAVAVVSANDCAVALAEHLYGTEEAFVQKMNERAAELGMENTHFVNCNGLPAEGHLTTARDIAIMSRELIKHQEIFKYTTIWMDTLRGGASGLTNTNRLIRTYQGMTGLKTGYTQKAGYCLSGTATREGLSLVAVAMGASSSALRNADITAMLNYGFSNYQAVEITPDQPLMPIPVLLGSHSKVSCMLGQNEPLILKKEKVAALEKELTMQQKLKAPVQAGQQVGVLRLTVEGEEVASIPVVAAETVEALRVPQIFWKILKICAMDGALLKK